MTAGKRAINVMRIGRDEPVRFAASEISRYLRRMTGAPVRVSASRSYAPDQRGIWIGLASHFSPAAPDAARSSADPLCDRVFIAAARGHVVIAGANPRSVLFAAYRYLEVLGCRWLRPGRDGERVPRVRSPFRKTFTVSEEPSTKLRCICIEGSCSEQHVLNMVDYAAKKGFNAYFIQFANAYMFFKMWYRHEMGKAFTVADADAVCDRVRSAMRRRGLVMNRFGHAWTCAPFGLESHEWAPVQRPVARRTRRFLAKVNGKRELQIGIPLATNVCLSNPTVRNKIADSVAAHAQSAPADFLHIALGDSPNTQCECRRCIQARPSDFYVQLLNGIDKRLSERGLRTRIVFHSYLDLLWAPLQQRLRRPDRFLFMFAPITRPFTRALCDREPFREKIAPYRRNKLSFPVTANGNLHMLRTWQRFFGGDCILFDYHLYFGSPYDPGQMHTAGVLHRDLKSLRKLGLSGFISCQPQRICFPTGIQMEVMARTLWNRKVSLQAVAREYFRDVFGQHAQDVQAYLATLSRLFTPVGVLERIAWCAAMGAHVAGNHDREGSDTRRQALRNLSRVPSVVEAFLPVIEDGCRRTDRIHAASWQILRHHAWYTPLLARYFSAYYGNDTNAAQQVFEAMEQGLAARRKSIHHVCDTRCLPYIACRRNPIN